CLRALSPLLRGEGRGEGCFNEQMTRGKAPHPNPLPLKKGERERWHCARLWYASSTVLYTQVRSGDRMKAWIWRLEAWLAAALLRPANVPIAIALFALAGFVVLVEVKYFQDLFKDNAEAFAWGRQFLGGYGRHPVLTGWIAGIWYHAFPASDWASY